MTTPRQEALALIARVGADFNDRSAGERDRLVADAFTPVGVIWAATGCHTLVIANNTNRPEGWRQFLDDLRQGTRPCDQPDCDTCESADTPTTETPVMHTDSAAEIDIVVETPDVDHPAGSIHPRGRTLMDEGQRGHLDGTKWAAKLSRAEITQAIVSREATGYDESDPGYNAGYTTALREALTGDC